MKTCDDDTRHSFLQKPTGMCPTNRIHIFIKSTYRSTSFRTSIWTCAILMPSLIGRRAHIQIILTIAYHEVRKWHRRICTLGASIAEGWVHISIYPGDIEGRAVATLGDGACAAAQSAAECSGDMSWVLSTFHPSHNRYSTCSSRRPSGRSGLSYSRPVRTRYWGQSSRHASTTLEKLRGTAMLMMLRCDTLFT